jgi:hypothetical protein
LAQPLSIIKAAPAQIASATLVIHFLLITVLGTDFSALSRSFSKTFEAQAD